MLPEGRHSISISQINTWAQCGLRYWFEYVDNRKQPDTLYTAVGHAWHQAVEDFEDSGRTGNLYDFARAALRRRGDFEQLPYWGKQGPEWWYKEGLYRLSQNYLQVLFSEYEHLDVVDIEKHTRVTLADDLPYINGYIDQVLRDHRSGKLAVRDIKTGKQQPSHVVQLELYRVAAEIEYGEPVEWMASLYLNGTTPTQNLYYPALSHEELTSLVRSFVQAQSYPVTGPLTGACDSCPFKLECPYSAIGQSNVLW